MPPEDRVAEARLNFKAVTSDNTMSSYEPYGLQADGNDRSRSQRRASWGREEVKEA